MERQRGTLRVLLDDSLNATTLPRPRLSIVCDGIFSGGHRHGTADDCLDSVTAERVYVGERKPVLRW
jgi:hypothetical protein